MYIDLHAPSCDGLRWKVLKAERSCVVPAQASSGSLSVGTLITGLWLEWLFCHRRREARIYPAYFTCENWSWLHIMAYASLQRCRNIFLQQGFSIPISTGPSIGSIRPIALQCRKRSLLFSNDQPSTADIMVHHNDRGLRLVVAQ